MYKVIRHTFHRECTYLLADVDYLEYNQYYFRNTTSS